METTARNKTGYRESYPRENHVEVFDSSYAIMDWSRWDWRMGNEPLPRHRSSGKGIHTVGVGEMMNRVFQAMTDVMCVCVITTCFFGAFGIGAYTSVLAEMATENLLRMNVAQLTDVEVRA